MTNYDMEQRLRRAAADLPEPKGGLTAAEQTKARRRRSPMVYVAAVIVVALLIPAGIATGGGVSGYPSNATVQTVEDEGFRLPGALGGYLLKQEVGQINLAPQEYEETQAIEAPDYVHYNVEYWQGELNALQLYVGKTDNDLWYHCYGYDRDTGAWLLEQHEYSGDYDAWRVEKLCTVEYRGCTIYLYDHVQQALENGVVTQEFRDAEACWVDETMGFVCKLTWGGVSQSEFQVNGVLMEDYERPYTVLTQDELLEYVKLIIDAQR